MRKKNLLAGVYNVYAVFDKVSKHYRSIHFASNDEDFVRTILPSIIVNVALRDINVFKIATFNDVTGELKSSTKKMLKTDCYYFPYSRLSPPGENLDLETIETELQNTKNEIIAQTSTKEEEYE